MKKYWIIFLFYLLKNCSFGQKKDSCNYIPWKETIKLNWGNFKGKYDHSSNINIPTAAITNCILSMTKDKKVLVLFDQLKSSFDDQKFINDSLLLSHEQLHFDILEYFARKIRKEHAKYDDADEIIPDEKYHNIFHHYFNESELFQTLYDNETEHGSIKEKQEEWIYKVKILLDELKDYTLNDISIEDYCP
ncbi:MULTISPECIES: hypothetical protein [unclassified Arcicella]|uniref:hypothetical protein n=1 Tax=unclassified Arcicella TaxID=2644986 RepID=UPI00285B1451|nr:MULTISPECIES: hypothetical protein [unclassified Arcicella]MDR6563542.1 hypothetical protein [Arcicella sp. BE51]MDR6813346.1 hypothetical protein [Arcicella sp. BE140]MDR6824659.1 hypothetical protein [Arcicella sp. BE139]